MLFQAGHYPSTLRARLDKALHDLNLGAILADEPVGTGRGNDKVSVILKRWRWPLAVPARCALRQGS